MLPAGNSDNRLSLDNITTQADLVKLRRKNPTYNQPLNGDVDPDTKVKIVRVKDSAGKVMTFQ